MAQRGRPPKNPAPENANPGNENLQNLNESSGDQPESKIKPPKGDVSPESQQLKEVMKMLEQMREDRKKDREEINMLRQVADKGAMAKWEARQERKIIRTVMLHYYNNQLIVAWRSIMDRVWKDNDDNWHERQTYEISTEDGMKKQLDIREFTNDLEKRPAKVIKREQHYTEDMNGVEVLNEVFTVQPDGREDTVELKGNFVN